MSDHSATSISQERSYRMGRFRFRFGLPSTAFAEFVTDTIADNSSRGVAYGPPLG